MIHFCCLTTCKSFYLLRNMNKSKNTHSSQGNHCIKCHITSVYMRSHVSFQIMHEDHQKLLCARYITNCLKLFFTWQGLPGWFKKVQENQKIWLFCFCVSSVYISQFINVTKSQKEVRDTISISISSTELWFPFSKPVKIHIFNVEFLYFWSARLIKKTRLEDLPDGWTDPWDPAGVS